MAHIITRLDVGGAQETAIRVCAGLDRSRFAPVLLAGPDEGSGGSLRSAADGAGIEVITVDALHGPIRPLDDARAVRELTQVLAAQRAAVVQTHSSKAGVVGRLAARRAGVAHLVHTVHGWSFNDSQAAPVALGYRTIERWLAKRTDVLIVVTSADRELGLRHGIGRPDQYEIIRSGIALGPDAGAEPDGGAARRALRQELGWAPSDQVVISVGRLEAQKDPITMVEALAIARRSAPALRLALVGSGALDADVRATTARLGLDGAVDLLGLRDDVPQLLSASDLFALSSRWEGLPRAALEAMRAGLPVAATDTGGIREVVVDGDTGLLVPIGDAAALGAALVALASDPPMASAMAERAAALLPSFSEARMVADVEALYDRLLRGTTVPVARP
ncbi:glycosyltransferase family 4 protein [Aquihabitans sp. McL0605]|uniref:glycosyltransferase family 4 protein n=1 Tax=Aquihabitans sp. McL0605 TaxID=3415671 RepID=UPI003CF80722